MNRLIYKSRSLVPLDWEIVREISSASERNNSRDGVNGVLLATQNHFLQILEGTYEGVNTVFRRIARDERHTELSLVDFSVIDAQLFDGWGMRGIGVFDMNRELERELKQKYGEEEGSVRFPLEAWQVLALVHDIRMMRELPKWKT